MKPSPALISALSDFVAKNISKASRYAWKVNPSAWQTLEIGFDHKQFGDDLHKQNMELKYHFSKHWANASLDEKLRLAEWIVSDWGGIHRNPPMKILGYVNQVDAERPSTPFAGIASYSKILAMKDPYTHAIYDARVAGSLNALQLLLNRDNTLSPFDGLSFLVPLGRNKLVNRFSAAAPLKTLEGVGYSSVEKDEIYGVYLSILGGVSGNVGKSILEIEMFLFAQADDLCTQALPVAKSMNPAMNDSE